jgi:hypothetical protein
MRRRFFLSLSMFVQHTLALQCINVQNNDECVAVAVISTIFSSSSYVFFLLCSSLFVAVAYEYNSCLIVIIYCRQERISSGVSTTALFLSALYYRCC